MSFDAVALTRLPRVGEVAASPDGTWLAVVVQHLDPDESKYLSDLWRVPLDGSPAVRLTRGPSKDATPRFRADGALGFLSDRNPRDGSPSPGDADRMQVWLLPIDGSEARPITDEPLGVTDFAFGGDRLVVLAEVFPHLPVDKMRAHAADLADRGPTALRYTETPVRHWDSWLPASSLHLIVYDASSRTNLTPTARHQLRNNPGDPGLAVSPDGARIAVAWSELGADRVPDGWIHLVDVATRTARDLGRAPGVCHAAPRFSRDGRLAAERHTRARMAADVQRLVVFDDDAAGRVIADAWDVPPNLAGWTDDGALLAVAPDEGHVAAYRVGLDGAVTRLTARDAGGSHDHVVALRGRAAIAGARHTLLHPPEPFVCEPGAAPRLLASLSGFTADDGASLATWESRWTPGDGGTPVQYFLLRPRADAPAPLLLWIHGGPVGQYADGWHWRWNPLIATAAGYAVAMPNPRGSTGRGQRFIDGVYGNSWGAACYRDLLACVDEALTLPGIDRKRAAAMGGSFGGYMANWIGTQTDRFRCLVSHAGLFHLGAFYGATDYPGYMAIEFGAHPFEGDPEVFRRYSPDAFAMRWKTPVLFIHGERDYRVPITEALMAFEAVRTAGVDAELLVFPDENHWILRPRNVRAWYAAWLDFVARHMS